MNWIKIDHNDYSKIDIGSGIFLYNNENHVKGCGKCVLDEDGSFIIYNETNGTFSNIRDFTHRTVFEEPKKRKYNSIDEFYDTCGFFPDVSYSRLRSATRLKIDWFCHHQKPGVYKPKWKSFSGGSWYECEQKLLEWANDEM